MVPARLLPASCYWALLFVLMLGCNSHPDRSKSNVVALEPNPALPGLVGEWEAKRGYSYSITGTAEGGGELCMFVHKLVSAEISNVRFEESRLHFDVRMHAKGDPGITVSEIAQSALSVLDSNTLIHESHLLYPDGSISDATSVELARQ